MVKPLKNKASYKILSVKNVSPHILILHLLGS